MTQGFIMKTKYDSSSIDTLKFPDLIRRNVSMYLGSSDEHGRWLIARELLDNGLDEALAGRNTAVALLEMKDGSYWVLDNGAGVPQGTKVTTVNINGKHVKSKMPTMQAIFSELHTSGKYRSEAYKVSVGSHGVGAKGTNATSDFFEVYTCFEHKWYSIKFERGILTQPVKQLAKAPKGPTGKALKKGTAIHFKPDATIFSGKSNIDLKFAHQWAEITSYLTPGFTVLIVDRKGKQTKYYSKEGPSEYVTKILQQLKAEAEQQRFTFKNELCDIVVAFSNAEGLNIRGYTNGLFNGQGGKHVDSVCNAILTALKPFAKKKQTLSAYDVKEGLVGIVNMKLHKAEFSSQDKARLTDLRAGKEFEELLVDQFTKFFKSNKALAMRLCEKASKLGALRTQFKASKKVVQALNQVKRKGMPSKYAPYDARTKVQDRELLIVEGESASGGLREKRKPYQALAPLKGKISNAAKNGQKVLESEEVIMILGALGFDPKLDDPMRKLQVQKIICLADPDPDGCWSANTKVLLCDGTQKTFKQLTKQWEKTKEPIWVWSLDKKGKLHPAQAFDIGVKCTRDKYAVITLDDGTKFKCTLNHPFAVNYSANKADKRNKGISYVYAKNLMPGDSIVSAYFTYTNSLGDSSKDLKRRYLSVYEQGKKVPVHKIVMKDQHPKKYKKYKNANIGVIGGAIQIHHINDNPLDNRPENLQFLSRDEHYGLHGRKLSQQYNGSAKHLSDIKKFKATELGKINSEQARQNFIKFNKSDYHRRNTVLMNKDDDQIKLQQLGKLARYYLGLKNIGLEYTKENFELTCVVTKRNTQCSLGCKFHPLSEVLEFMKTHKVEPYNVQLKSEVDKAKYPTQKISKFVTFANMVLQKYEKLNKVNYDSYRSELLAKGKIARGTPKWDTVVPLLETKNVLSFVKRASKNHKVVKVEIKDCSPTDFYCLEVPKYGNFLVADKNGNGVCSSNCHINSLLLTLFYKYLPQLFNEGRIFVADVPELYAQYKDNLVMGDTLSEVQAKLQELKAPKTTPIHHIKGWGEIDASLMDVLAVNPETRKLIQIKPIEHRDTVEFVACMNDDVAFRRKMLNLPE
jgi:DNA gyrase subunit B